MRRLFHFIALAASLATFPAARRNVRSTTSHRAHIPMTVANVLRKRPHLDFLGSRVKAHDSR